MSSDKDLGAVLRDRYEILSTLGEGGFGTVHKARQIATGQQVAIKVLRLPEGRPAPEREKRITRFQREMQLCAQLHHPNIVRMIDSGHADGDVVYTVFEFAPGKDLAQVIADEGRLDPSEAKHLMLQVLDALAAAHAQGVIHRDLKPANLMVIPTGARRNALVLDFGIGALTDEARRDDQTKITLTNESIGTPSYAAPEQLRGQSPTPRSDLYAWGLVFLECLTGKRVVEGDTVAEVVFKQLSPEPIPIPTVIADHPLGSLLRRVTAKEATARDVTAQGILRDLEACDVSGLRPRTGPTRLTPSSPSAATETVEIGSLKGTPSQRLVEGERRQITAVCCTLGASGTGAAASDPEELDQLLGLQQEACIAAARRFGGHVAGALGDTLLFYFGYPTAREDDARRAARAALTLVAEMRSRSLALQAERNVSVDVRIGIHTGLVVARELRDPTITGLGYVVGLTPKLATRLSTLAAPGSILLSGETRKLLRKEFLIEAAAIHPAEAGAHALETYLLHEGSPASGADDLVLVGRGREMETLTDRWAKAQSGSGQVVLIAGEPGIGKSRLARELGERIADQQHTWLECRCTPDSANTAFYPIVDLLDRMLDPARETKPETKVEKLEALLSLYGFELAESMPLFGPLLSFTLPKRWPALEVSPQKQRELTRNAVLSLLFEIAEREPVVLLLEDLHWADPSTLELLSHFVSDVASARILALFTARPEFTPSWPSAAVHTLQLGRLGPADVQHMASAITGGRALPADVLEQIATRTDGVPLFVEELVRTMIESGALVEAGDHYALAKPLSELSIPTSLRDSLVARLDRLGRAKETAQVAATIGREFTFELLRAVSPLEESAAQEDLDKLVAAELVYRKRRLKNPSYLFKHALIRDAAYDSMLKRSKQQVHARVAGALTEKFPDVTRERPELVAHHHAEAGMFSEAIPFALKAGQRSAQQSADLEAERHLTGALGWLAHLDPAPARDGLELQLRGSLAPIYMTTKGFASPEVEQTLDRMVQLVGALGDSPDLFIMRWSRWGFLLNRGRQLEALALAKENLEVAEKSGHQENLMIAHMAMGGGSMFAMGRGPEAIEHLDKAAKLYDFERFRPYVIVYGQEPGVTFQAQRGLVLCNAGLFDQAAEADAASRRFADASNHVHSQCMALALHEQHMHYRGDRDEIRRTYGILQPLCAKHAVPQWDLFGSILFQWAEAATNKGAYDTLKALVNGYAAFGARILQSLWACLLSDACLSLGMLDEGLEHTNAGLAFVAETEERWGEAEIQRLQGELHAAKGDDEAAERWMRTALDTARKQQSKLRELRAATSLATLLQRKGKASAARDLLGPVCGWFTEGADVVHLRDARALLASLG